MKLNIRTLTGNTVEVTVAEQDTVERVKELIEALQGIDPKQQRLIFAGKAMADERTLKDYGIKDNDIIHMVLALRG